MPTVPKKNLRKAGIRYQTFQATLALTTPSDIKNSKSSFRQGLPRQGLPGRRRILNLPALSFALFNAVNFHNQKGKS